jgi:flavin reductase (DIM6/NTAB) family NADH-FMN oxidoreductase RutF
MTDKDVQNVMHEMPYGLYIIGCREEGGRVNAMMADWVMQVSFNPRFVAVSFENDSHTFGQIRKYGFFTVNLLSEDEDSMELARSFAQPCSGAKVQGREEAEARKVHYKLDGIEHTVTENGCPVLAAALGWFECRAEQFIPIGDHTLVIGRVLDGRIEREGAPLTSTFTGWTYSG